MTAASDPNKDQAKSDFLAAEEIKGILRDREKSEQERIVRWVCESLGLATSSSGTVVPTAPSPTLPSVVPHVPHANPVGRSTDIRAFVEAKQPKSDVQFAVLVAYFHRFEASEAHRKESISPDDLEVATRHADWKRFNKPAVPLNNAATLGYLDRVGGGSFKINAVGENLVAMALPGINREGNGKRRPAKKSTKNKTKRLPRKPKA